MAEAENPFSKAAKRRTKEMIKGMDPKARKELEKIQGEYGVGVAESVRGSHNVWRKGRRGDKRYI